MADEHLVKLKSIQGQVKLHIKTLTKQLEFWKTLDEFLAEHRIILENIKPFYNLMGNIKPLMEPELEEEPNSID